MTVTQPELPATFPVRRTPLFGVIPQDSLVKPITDEPVVQFRDPRTNGIVTRADRVLASHLRGVRYARNVTLTGTALVVWGSLVVTNVVEPVLMEEVEVLGALTGCFAAVVGGMGYLFKNADTPDIRDRAAELHTGGAIEEVVPGYRLLTPRERIDFAQDHYDDLRHAQPEAVERLDPTKLKGQIAEHLWSEAFYLRALAASEFATEDFPTRLQRRANKLMSFARSRENGYSRWFELTSSRVITPDSLERSLEATNY